MSRRISMSRTIPIFAVLLFGALSSKLPKVSAQNQSRCLDWPMGQRGGTYSPGSDLEVLQNYNNRFPDFDNRRHAGVDLRYRGGGAATVGAAVHAAAAGRVVCRATSGYPGGVLVLEHRLPDGTTRYTQYGHLNGVFVGMGQEVGKGDPLGTVLDQGSNTHLHFEYRNWLHDPVRGDCPGAGYAHPGVGDETPDAQGWQDPVAAIFRHKLAFPRFVYTPAVSLPLRSAPSSSATTLDNVPAGSTVLASGVADDRDGSGHWYYRVEYRGRKGYLPAFEWAGWGSFIHLGADAETCN